MSEKKVAVIGLGCWYPGARNPKEFWENILTKRRQMRRMLDCRLPLSEYYSSDRSINDKTYGDKSSYIDGFIFDWINNRIPKQTYESTDIVHWLAYEVAKMALADSSLDLEKINREKMGVILGNTLTGEQVRSNGLGLRWPFVRKAVRKTAEAMGLDAATMELFERNLEYCFKSAFPKVTEDTLAGGLSNTIAGRICNYFDLKGGGFTVDGACSSSLIAVNIASSMLEKGSLDCVFAGGVDISLDTFELIGFAKTKALAGNEMLVFDKKSEGFIPGEGCGFVVLKRYDDAMRDGDYVYASLNGWGMSTDGRGGVTAPSVLGQTLSISRAYEHCSYKAKDIRFVECHGTGTAVGDPIELEAIANAIHADGDDVKPRSCGVTSLKSLVGHMKAAAGIGGFIKTVIAVNRRVIPPLAILKDPNPVFGTKAKALYPIVQGEVLAPDATVRAGVSAMGFGGINLHVTLQSENRPSAKFDSSLCERKLLASSQDSELFPFSAADAEGLRVQIGKAKAETLTMSIAEIQDYSKLLCDCVDFSMPIKACVIATDPRQSCESLLELENCILNGFPESGRLFLNPARTVFISNSLSPPRIGFLFPGQGSQRLNMARVLLERHNWARDWLDAFDKRELTGEAEKLSSCIYRDTFRAEDQTVVDAWQENLKNTRIAQPAILLASFLWYQRLAEIGILPDAVGGHSLGELMAAYAAGILDLDQMMDLVKLRAAAMSIDGDRAGSMVSLVCDAAAARSLAESVSGYAVISNYNGPEQTVVSGDKATIAQLTELAEKKAILHKILPVSNAFHSAYMQRASDSISSSFRPTKIGRPDRARFFSGVYGKELAALDSATSYFAEQVMKPVDFVSMVKDMSESTDLLIEVGPGRVLSNLVRAITKNDNLCFPVESIAQQEREFNIVAANFFVRGGHVKFGPLFKNRLIRPYVDFTKKTFIENPCEHELSVDFSKRDAVLASGDNEGQGNLNAEAVESLLKQLVSQWTGFPIDQIHSDSKLLNDLNLESIRAGELIATIAQQCGVGGKVDPASLVQASVRDVAEAIIQATMLQDGSGAAGGLFFKRIIAHLNAKQDRPNWVRTFTLRDEHEPIAIDGQAIEAFWKDARVLALNGDGAADADVRALREALLPFDAEVVVMKADSIRFIAEDRDEGFTHLCCMTRETEEAGAETAARLRSSVEFLTDAVSSLARFRTIKTAAFLMIGEKAHGSGSFVASLHHERPDLKIRAMAFEADASPAMIATSLVREFSSDQGFSSTTYADGGERLIPKPLLVEPWNGEKSGVDLSGDDVVVVTGGSKGITAECAFQFARRYGAKVALLGRSPAPEASDQDNEINKRLLQYRAENLCAMYLSCDVNDIAQVADAFRRIESELGPIAGLIHGAGTNQPRRVETVSASEAYREISTKVLGFANCVAALGEGELKLLVGFSSIIGVTGMPGNAWYAYSNESLSRQVKAYKGRHPRAHAVSLAYSVWEGIGMGARMGSVDVLSDMGIAAIPAELGVGKFLESIALQFDAAQLVITSRLGGLDSWYIPGKPEESRTLRYADEVVAWQQGVEAIVKTKLTVEGDTCVADHCYKQTYLFPTVFGLESMAQALAMALGVRGFRSLYIENVKLDRPIVVKEEKGEEILIHAEIKERSDKNEPVAGRAAIFTATTGFETPHFSASFVVNQDIPPPSAIPSKSGHARLLEIAPKSDLYGRFLFQGPSFQRISGVLQLQDNAFILQSTRRDRIGEDGQEYLSGDPYFRDSMLQAGQVALPRKKCLPTAIGRIEIIKPTASETEPCFLNGTLIESGDEKIVCDVIASNRDGEVVERMLNVEFAVLERDETEPDGDDFKDPDPRDQALLDGKIRQTEGMIRYSFPAVAIGNLTELGRLTDGKERLAREKGVLDEAVLSHFDRYGKKLASKSLSYDHRENGKPAINGYLSKKVDVSLAHDRRFCIASAGGFLQGCDIEPVMHHDIDQWKALLGPSMDAAFEQLTKVEVVDYAGTRAWCAMEALYKATNSKSFRLMLSQKKQDVVVFAALIDGVRSYAATFPIRLTLGLERIVACVVAKDKVGDYRRNLRYHNPLIDSVTRFPMDLVSHRLQKIGYDPSTYTMLGDWRNKILKIRCPLVFRESANLNKTVYFTHFIEWMGKIREIAMQPIYGEFSEQMISGKWGMVTNSLELDIVGATGINDVIESEFRIQLVPEQVESALDFFFEWKRILPDMTVERVARGKMRVTWVEILEHGLVRVEPFPDYFMAFIADRTLPEGAAYSPPPMKETFAGIEAGSVIYGSEDEGSPDEIALMEQTFQTTLFHGNLVGNIYFSHYVSWQAAMRDKFFFEIIPGYYKQLVSQGEWMCTKVWTTHLQDAMPFEKVNIEMALRRLTTRSAVLRFNYFRLTPGGKQKLAYGEQTVHWMARGQSGDLVSAQMPVEVTDYMNRKIAH
jgi:enediyne polyketide synthase